MLLYLSLLLAQLLLALHGQAAAPAAKLAADRPAAGSHLRAADYRIAAITYRIASRGTRFCKPIHPLTGMLLHHLGEYPVADRPEAARRFGVLKGPGVLAVVEGAPAAEAGLRAGDVLVSVNGKAFPSPTIAAAEKDDGKRRRLMDAAEEQLEEQLRAGPARIKLSRGNSAMDVVLRPRMGCLARGRLARSRQPNAFADGRYAILTTKLLEFMESDDEIAVALGHELAHNILGHPERLKAQSVPTGIMRNFGGNAARVLATEEEADRLGIKLVWAAGYNVSAAIPFWRRLYATYDPIPIPKMFRTHPTLGGRERMINETIAQLRATKS